jgi:hypothetical protein
MNLPLKKSTNYIVPIYHSEEYKDSFKEVLYTNHEYNEKGHIFLKPFLDITLLHLVGLDFYAYGLMFDIYNSKVCPIDLDGINNDSIINQCNILIQDPNIKDIDIIKSSQFNHYHIILGLKNYSYIKQIYEYYPYICHGFKTIALERRYSIIRTSPKYTKFNTRDMPKYIQTYRKHDDYIDINTNFKSNKTNKGINLRG